MPVYHFTFHAYRSWGPDHERGYTVKGVGFEAPDPEMAGRYDRAAAQSGVTFDEGVQRDLLEFCLEICAREGWRLEGAGFDPTHAHFVMSWWTQVAWEEVDRRLKNLLSLKMNRKRETPGRRWFVRRHGSPRRVKDNDHMCFLLEVYLPDHRGLVWRRGIEGAGS